MSVMTEWMTCDATLETPISLPVKLNFIPHNSPRPLNPHDAHFYCAPVVGILYVSMRTYHFHPSLKFPIRLYSPTVTTNVFRLFWVLLICWGEIGVYYWSLSACRWPMHKISGNALRALLISDTQFRAPALFPETASSLSHPRGFTQSKYMKKSWRIASRLKPDVVIFLGDMLGDGKLVENEAQFARLAQEFKRTFPIDAPTITHYLPGNNDVGMGLLSSPTKDIRKYFQKHFGPLNSLFTLNNYTFFSLDAPGLVDEDYQRNAHGASFNRWEPIPGGPVEAVKSVAAQHHHPLILLSHIPLYRPDSASCGPRRERGTIVRGAGRGYQNALGKQTTAFLMKTLKPAAVFSGDNRDYCEYVHKGNSFDVAGSIPEITVKPFSPSPHIRRPGFQLVSVVEPTNLASNAQLDSLLNRPCLLPDQTTVFTGYIWWTFTTLCVILLLNLQRIRNFRLTKLLGPSLTPSPSRSNRTSPSLQDADNSLSPVWSPHTPFPFMSPTNLTAQVPSIFRTPMAPATPTFRASSRPMTPQGFNGPLMLSPQSIPPMHDEDSMFPDQYTIQRDVRHLNDEEWTSIGREDYFDTGSQFANGLSTGGDESRGFSSPSQFISAPGNIPMHYEGRKTWTVLWTKSFNLGGRRRRISLRVPRLSACLSGSLGVLRVLRGADQNTLLRRRRGIFASTLLESISVFWPAGVVWVVINHWIF